MGAPKIGAAAHRSSVDAEISNVAVEPKARLRERYVELFGQEPPKSFGPDLLRRTVAFRIQEAAFGGVRTPTQRLLDRLVEAVLPHPAGKISVPRRTQAGTVLVRQWQGKSYRVTIMDSGFAYEGRIYASLSEIARLITGTRWNGPRFFGLRKEPALTKAAGATVIKKAKRNNPTLAPDAALDPASL